MNSTSETESLVKQNITANKYLAPMTTTSEPGMFEFSASNFAFSNALSQVSFWNILLKKFHPNVKQLLTN